MRILFTGVGRRVELLLAFRNAALVLNKPLEIYGADMDYSAPALAYCDYARKTVAMDDSGYVDNILTVCQTDGIDLIIPTIDTDLSALSENRERFGAIGTRVLVSSPETIRICRDKKKTSRFFRDCGLRCPVAVDNWLDYQGGYPAFIKPRDGSCSINAFKIEKQKELKFYSEQIDDYIVQPFIDGREYTVDVFCDWSGRPISIVPRERLRVRAGEVLKTRICMDQRMISESESICKALEIRGPVSVQLIRDSFGEDWFIEINARFGGGAPLSMSAGARSAESILKMMDGEEIDSCSNVEDGAIFSRFDRSARVVEGNSEIKGVIFDLDDTLYSEKDYARSGYKAVSDYLGGGYEEKLWKFFESGKPSIDELLKELGRESEKEIVLSVYRSHKPDIRPYDGAIEIIRRLKAEGKRVGVITDGRPEGQRNKIEALGLAELADDVIVTDEIGGVQFRKPCDVAFRIMQIRWRLSASQIAYVADNPIKDFQAPRQLGMKCVWFRNEDGLYLTSSEMNYISDIKELNV